MGNNGNSNNGNGKKFPVIILYILIPLCIVLAMNYYAKSQTVTSTSYYEIVDLFNEGKVESYKLNLSSGALEYTLTGEKAAKTYTVPSVSLFLEDVHEGVMAYNKENPGNEIKAEYISGAASSWLMELLPTLIMLAVMGIFTYFIFKKMGDTMGGEAGRMFGFGKAKFKMNKDEKRKTTFENVAGADEEKEELKEIVEFLKDASKFTKLGARIPKGVLLVGPPGTGKTLLARAVAGEANAPFFSISGSEFEEMYVGVGASRVRDLFAQAKKHAPSIIFIDEIDAVGRHRSANLNSNEQTLNQLLVEMDGFGTDDGVIVMAATNRMDILDPALLRPGRFDRQVTVNYPDQKGRVEILKVHSKGKPLGPDVDLESIARATVGFTGADLENLLNEAALLAARNGRKAITMSEVDEAALKVEVGSEKKSHKLSEKEKKLTAYHEAGHAVSAFYLDYEDPVHQISIIPRGLAGGYTLYRPDEDKTYATKKEMLDKLVSLYGGRVAEELVLGDISTGASNDIQRASQIAREMVTKYGMNEKIGPIAFGGENNGNFLGYYNNEKNYSETLAFEIDGEVEKIAKGAYDKCRDILSLHIDKLHSVAGVLLEKEKIEGAEFYEIMKSEEEAEAKANGEEIIDTIANGEKVIDTIANGEEIIETITNGDFPEQIPGA